MTFSAVPTQLYAQKELAALLIFDGVLDGSVWLTPMHYGETECLKQRCVHQQVSDSSGWLMLMHFIFKFNWPRRLPRWILIWAPPRSWPYLHRSFYTQKLLHTDTSTQAHFYTQTLLHTNIFTQKHSYTQTLLHRDTFTHKSFDTQLLLHRCTCTHKHFYTQTSLHRNTPTHKHVYTQTLLHTEAFTHNHV